MKSIILIFLFFLISIIGIGQNKITPILSQGKLPIEFVTSIAEKSDSIVKANTESYINYSHNKADFISHSTFLLNELLISGKILFNDSCSLLVNKIANELLKNEPDLKKQVRFFVIKSTSVNAFATLEGLIFVTTSLLARLENEAQLAFVLSHEISHYIKRHVITGFENNERIFSNNSKDHIGIDNKINAMSSYSKKMEYEADSLGLIRLLKSEYNPFESVNVLRILQVAHLPFKNVSFDPQVFFKESVIISNWKSNISKIDYLRHSDEEDKNSTHPSLLKRIVKLETALSNESDIKKYKYIINEHHFNRMVAMTRDEELLLLIANKEYNKAIYQALCLDNKLLQIKYRNIVAKSLYGNAIANSTSSFNTINLESKFSEGEFERLSHFLNSMTGEQSAILAFSYLHRLSTESKDDFLTKIESHIYLNLIDKYSINDKILFIKSKKINEKTFKIAKKISYNPVVSVYYDSLLKLDKDINFMKDLDDFVAIDIKNFDSIILSNFHEQVRNTQTNKNYVQVLGTSENDEDNLNLMIDSLLIVDPSYISFDNRDKIKVGKTEKSLKKLIKELEYVSKLNGIHSEIISPEMFKIEDIDNYNEMSILNSWYLEKSTSDESLIPLYSDFTNEILKKYKVKHVLFTHVLVQTIPKESGYAGLAILASFAIYPLFVTIPYLTQTNTHIFILANLFDLNNNKNLLLEFKDITNKNNSLLISNYLNEIFMKINSKKKK